MTESIRQQLEWATQTLNSISCSARLDSEILLAHCLDKNRSYLLTWPEQALTTEQLDCFRELIGRRLQPQPVAYLIGYREFYSLELITTPATLVPRAETELLVDTVLGLIDGGSSVDILELGTGTGAIALAIKKHAGAASIVACDISADALAVARANAQKHHLDIEFVESDWYQTIASRKFDLIVSNPPYIAAADPYLSQGDLPAEPQQALTSGESGLEALEVIISNAAKYLKADGWIVLEHGYDQQSAVIGLLQEASFNSIRAVRDFNDLPRLTLARISSITPNKLL